MWTTPGRPTRVKLPILADVDQDGSERPHLLGQLAGRDLWNRHAHGAMVAHLPPVRLPRFPVPALKPRQAPCLGTRPLPIHNPHHTMGRPGIVALLQLKTEWEATLDKTSKLRCTKL
jgi:hypothetical protein